MSNIYTMELHDTLNTDSNIHITRVPGGWIYNYIMRNYTVFIPYNNEFDKEGNEAVLRARIAEWSAGMPPSYPPPPPTIKEYNA